MLPACVDCHQPHMIRRVFYDEGVADSECLSCHENEDVLSSEDGRSLHVDASVLAQSRHVTTRCSQCHSGVNPSHRRPCDSISQKVDCTACHVEVGLQYQQSTHGTLAATGDPNAPTCK